MARTQFICRLRINKIGMRLTSPKIMLVLVCLFLGQWVVRRMAAQTVWQQIIRQAQKMMMEAARFPVLQFFGRV